MCDEEWRAAIEARLSRLERVAVALAVEKNNPGLMKEQLGAEVAAIFGEMAAAVAAADADTSTPHRIESER